MRGFLLLCLAALAVCAEPLTYAGSSTVAGLLQRVAPGVVTSDAAGSLTAVQALADGRAQVVGLSRELTVDERTAIAAKRGAEPVVRELGRGAVALFVHRGNPVANITHQQLAEACAGRLRWSALGVPGALGSSPVRVVTNNLRAGSTRLLADAILGGALPGEVRIEPVGSSVVQAAAVDEAVLAVASLHQATPAIRAVPLDGVLPEGDTLRDGRYLLGRPLLLVWMPGTPGIAPLVSALSTEEAARRLYDEGVF